MSPEKYRPKQKREEPNKLPTRVNGETYRQENPYKANKYIKDPRQDICWEIYLEMWMRGVPNGKKAALEAGYSETSSQNITNQPWFRERVAGLTRKEFLTKAERNFGKMLDLNYEKVDELGKTKIDVDVLRVVADISKTVATTLGKDVGYSTKSEVSKDVSGTIQIKSVNYADNAIEQPKQADVIDITGEEDE